MQCGAVGAAATMDMGMAMGRTIPPESGADAVASVAAAAVVASLGRATCA